MGIFKNKGNRELPAFYTGNLPEKQPGILPLFCIPVDYCRSYGMHNAIQNPFNIGNKSLTGRARIDSHPQFRDLDRSTHAPHYPDCKVLLRGDMEDVPHRLTLFEHLGIDKAVATGRTDCRNDENIRKIGNIFCCIQVFYLGIARWARTRNDCTQL